MPTTVQPVSFSNLWESHPSVRGEHSPCSRADGTPNFENQCAIRMGVALKDGGFPLGGFRGARCWYGHRHILRAQELANWLKTQVPLLGKVEVKSKATADDFAGRTGVIFFRDFWGPGNQGDHIDLWDGTAMAKGSDDFFTRAKDVWFWEVA